MNPLVAAIRYIHRSVIRDFDAVNETELLRRCVRSRRVAECAPHPLECSSLRIQNDYAMITVAIGYEQFAAIEKCIGRLMQILCVRVPGTGVSVSNLEKKLSGCGEFQDHVIR